ncbi:flagellar biosynthetic protein FliR [Mycetocola miduiensis]|uniref:Flagellar biosynthetic protein FliR n=1 Tax=Mycetocola miduiensis TaxID=995034 RepID=A0A1I4YW38_9MICO|nr:flagellar biosynthetic protein FliR [Mycetocola miduiensis]SFN42235.1 flagellar biosynthetic protein FliR [Mycetocola miduiensis]
MSISLDFAWIEAVLLASVRMVAFLVIAPPFSYGAIPVRIKGMLGVALALAVSPRLTPGYESFATADFLIALVAEILIGAVLGFLVMLVFAAVQSAGNLIDMFGGFQMAQGFDPQSMINGAQFSRLFHMTALALLFASGGYQLIFGGLVRTFSALPLGGMIDFTAPAEAMTHGVTQMFLASVQIAGPLLVVLFLADAGLGLLSRVAPALNAFALGFPLKIFLTLTLVTVTFVALPQVVSSLTNDAFEQMMGVR